MPVVLDLVQPAFTVRRLGAGRDDLQSNGARNLGRSRPAGQCKVRHGDSLVGNTLAPIGCQAGRGVLSHMQQPASAPATELEEELRLIEKETGIARSPTAPLAGYVRAVARTGNPRALRLLAQLKAAFTVVV